MTQCVMKNTVSKIISFLSKILIGASILLVAHFTFNKTANINTLEYQSKKTETYIPQQLRWHDSFKGIENLPSKNSKTSEYKNFLAK